MYYQFDKYLVDHVKSKIYLDGELISDDEKSVKLVCLLCAGYPDVVEKQTLIESLWPDQVVTDWSLSKLVSDVRQLLGDNGKDQGYIKTIRGKGFKFNSEVSQHLEQVKVAKSSVKKVADKKNLIAVALTLLVISVLAIIFGWSANTPTNQSVLRVAVMPVQSETHDPINEWVKYGVMSMASEQLGRYESIQTIPVPTVISSISESEFTVKKSPSEEQSYYQSVCIKIGCSHLVAIKHRVENNTAVLSYQIFNADKRSGILEFVQPDVFDAATMLLDYLASDLIPDEKQHIALSDTFSSDQKANRDYAIGVNELLIGDMKAAKDYLNLAIKKQPSFFWANAYLAEVYYRTGELARATELIEALMSQREPGLSASQRYFLDHLTSNILYTQGKLIESLELSKSLLSNPHAMDDPFLSARELLNVGSTYQALGQLEQAADFLQQAMSKYRQANFAAGEGKALFNLGNVYLSQSQLERAIEHYQKAREIFIRFEMVGYALMAKHQTASTSISLGKIQFAEAELRQLVESYKQIGDLQGELTALVDLVDVSLAKNNTQDAIARLQQLIPRIDQTQFSYLQNHIRRLAAVTYLRAEQPEKAEQYVAMFDGNWSDNRPAFAFVPAHILLLKSDFEGAIEMVRSVKDSISEQWTDSHQAIYEQFELAYNEKKIMPIRY